MTSDAEAYPHELRSAAERENDDVRYAEIANELVEAADAVVGSWIEGLVVDRVRELGGEVNEEVAAQASQAGRAARDGAIPAMRRLVLADIDDQAANPLAVLRDATRHAHSVLVTFDLPAPTRDQFAESSFPEDIYDLVPATWADIHPSLHEPGITWGAAKAYLFKARRRDEERE